MKRRVYLRENLLILPQINTMKNLFSMNRGGSKLKKEKQLTKVQCLLIFLKGTVLT